MLCEGWSCCTTVPASRAHWSTCKQKSIAASQLRRTGHVQKENKRQSLQGWRLGAAPYWWYLLRCYSQTWLLVRSATNHHFSLAVTTESQESSNLQASAKLWRRTGKAASVALGMPNVTRVSAQVDDTDAKSSYSRLPHCLCSVRSVAEPREPADSSGSLCPNLALDSTSHPLLSCRTPTIHFPRPAQSISRLARTVSSQTLSISKDRDSNNAIISKKPSQKKQGAGTVLTQGRSHCSRVECHTN